MDTLARLIEQRSALRTFPSRPNLAFHGALMTATLVALSNQRESYHWAIAIVSAATIVAYIFLLFASCSERGGVLTLRTWSRVDNCDSCGKAFNQMQILSR